MIVKRLVCIEDLGNVDVLFTDKTGTLTQGSVSFRQALDPGGKQSRRVLERGLASSDPAGNELDRALCAAAGTETARPDVLDTIPFDHERQLVSVLVPLAAGAAARRQGGTRGDPRPLQRRSGGRAGRARRPLRLRHARRRRREPSLLGRPARPLRRARAGPRRLPLLRRSSEGGRRRRARAPRPARRPRQGRHRRQRRGRRARLPSARARPGSRVTGAELDAIDDDALADGSPATTIFARVAPEQKSRVIPPSARSAATSPSSATGSTTRSRCTTPTSASRSSPPSTSPRTPPTSAADEGPRHPRGRRRRGPADLRQHDQVRADGHVVELREHVQCRRRVALSVVPADVADADPAQQPALRRQRADDPDRQVDEELLARPAHGTSPSSAASWSSSARSARLFDFAHLRRDALVFHADAQLFRSGWFVESLATQTLVVFVIRTRRVPFFRSRPSTPLLARHSPASASGSHCRTSAPWRGSSAFGRCRPPSSPSCWG